jgi:hypothetical protein
MPTWGQLLKEHAEYMQTYKKPPFDFIRRKYLKQLSDYTKRNTILYASAWTQKPETAAYPLSINEEDIQGFMEVIHDLKGNQLDIVIHSPGGFLDATAAVVTYLRTRFEHIRVIIPYAAMSAATMLACSADEIVMGNHSFIGPIDPQTSIQTRLGLQTVPAQSISEQFEMAKEECKTDPTNLAVWLPILEQYGPALLKESRLATELSIELVGKWLASYMFKGTEKAAEVSNEIANKLSNHTLFKSHGRHIGISEARALGLKITALEDDKTLQDLVLSVFHCVTQTLDATSAVKIIENHMGFAFIKQIVQILVKEEKPVQETKKDDAVAKQTEVK